MSAHFRPVLPLLLIVLFAPVPFARAQEGGSAAQLEQAIGAIEAMRTAVDALSPDADPAAWTAGQNRLGGALLEISRSFGGAERRNLLGQAIAAFRAALTRLHREADAESWSNASFNLASALLEDAELAGDAEAKQELAEARQLLQTVDGVVPGDFAALSAAVASRLGDVHAALARRGDRAAWQSAADQYQRALARLPASAKERRALLEYRLAVVLLERSRLERVGGQFRLDALAAFERAGAQVDPQASSYLWATLNKDWADSLLEHAISFKGERAANLVKQAAEKYEIALAVYTRESDPETWRHLINNQGAALLRHAQEAPEAEAQPLLVRAGKNFGELSALTERSADPLAWARLEHNLGMTYRQLAFVQKSDDPAAGPFFELAIGHFRAALEVFTRKAHPHEWAEVQTNLAITLQESARLKEPAEAAPLIDEASALMRAAREVLDAEAKAGQ